MRNDAHMKILEKIKPLPFFPSPDVNSLLKCSCRKHFVLHGFTLFCHLSEICWNDSCKLTVPTRLMAHVKQWLAIAAFLASIGHMGSLQRRRNVILGLLIIFVW